MSINIIKVYQNLVLKEFPIAKHLGVNIHNIEENSVYEKALLKNNINIHGTVFGGSLYSVGVLTGWILVKYLLDKNNITGNIFIKNANIEYKKPITNDFIFKSTIPPSNDIIQFFDRLQTMNKASLNVISIINNNLSDNVIFNGCYTVTK